MTRVVLDTSALTAPVQCDVRLFEEIDRLVADPELLVPRPVVVELDGLAADGGEAGTAASVGRDLVERCEVVATEATFADDAVIEAALAPAPTAVPVGGGAEATTAESESQSSEPTDGSTAESEPTDGSTAEAGAETDAIAVTNDHPLRDRLHEAGVRVIGLRGEATLQLTEP